MKKKTARIFFLTVMMVFLLLGASVIVQSSDRSELIRMDASEREAAINKLLPGKEFLLTPFRAVGAATGKRYFPEENFVISDDGQIYKESSPSDPEFAADKTEALYRTCREQGLNFLYVIAPGKPLNDEDVERYGVDCARNYSADLLREALQARDVPVLDLRDAFRDELKKSGDSSAFFYRKDHHWNADAGLMAARLISGDLNDRFDLSLKVDNLDEKKMGREVYPNAFVGEMGMKALGKFGGRDDFIRRFPLYDTHFRFICPQIDLDETGGFEVFTNEARLNDIPCDYGTSLYYYYMYGNYCHDEIFNKDVSNGEMLMIKDSFSCVVSPFLALTCKHMTLWDMREDANITGWIKNHPELETVIVVYNIAFVTNSEMNDFQ